MALIVYFDRLAAVELGASGSGAKAPSHPWSRPGARRAGSVSFSRCGVVDLRRRGVLAGSQDVWPGETSSHRLLRVELIATDPRRAVRGFSPLDAREEK